jgi:hypothetical protein
MEITVRPTSENGGWGVMRNKATGKEHQFWRPVPP